MGPGRDPASRNRAMPAYLRTKMSLQLEQRKQEGSIRDAAGTRASLVGSSEGRKGATFSS